MSKYAVFSMDVEDVYDSFGVLDGKGSMMDGFSSYLDLLDRYSIKGTFFVLASRLDLDKPLLLQAIARGHQIGLHGYNHKRVVRLPVDEFKRQIALAKEKLERELGVKIAGYRAPAFSIRQDQIDALKEIGLRYDCSVQDYFLTNFGAKYDLSSYRQIYDSVYQKDGFTCFSMTLSTGHPIHHMPVSGGGYFRMPPWHFVNRVLLKTIHERSFYIFYCHPFELSKKKVPNSIRLYPWRKWYLRKSRSTYLSKIEGLIQALKKEGYEFVTFEEMLTKIA